MDPRIRIILRLLDGQATDHERSLATASQLFGLSDAHLRRLFKRHVGVPLRRYLLEIRMTRAAELLGNYHLAVKHIAMQTGYKDVSNFYRDFRGIHGMTPQQLRISRLQPLLQSRNVLQTVTASLPGAIEATRSPSNRITAVPASRNRPA